VSLLNQVDFQPGLGQVNGGAHATYAAADH
jgi:hypothetical protein